MAKSGGAPVIGMPAQMDPESDQQYLSRNYSDAVALAGGVPIIIPLITVSEPVEIIAGTLDGILLTGSHSDIEPGLYHQPRSNACGPAQPLRDQMDFLLLETAFKRKIPILAICFGIQSLNVFLGGSLIQDISTAINTPIRHSRLNPSDCPSHEITISPGSLLEEIAGGRKFTVNSTHHQAVECPGRGLEAIAHAGDGVIESVSGTNRGHWILGVQWHPEKGYSCDELSRKIFHHFLARCRAV
jgi:putative glutamine amidotransferase